MDRVRRRMKKKIVKRKRERDRVRRRKEGKEIE